MARCQCAAASAYPNTRSAATAAATRRAVSGRAARGLPVPGDLRGQLVPGGRQRPRRTSCSTARSPGSSPPATASASSACRGRHASPAVSSASSRAADRSRNPSRTASSRRSFAQPAPDGACSPLFLAPEPNWSLVHHRRPPGDGRLRRIHLGKFSPSIQPFWQWTWLAAVMLATPQPSTTDKPSHPSITNFAFTYKQQPSCWAGVCAPVTQPDGHIHSCYDSVHH